MSIAGFSFGGARPERRRRVRAAEALGRAQARTRLQARARSRRAPRRRFAQIKDANVFVVHAAGGDRARQRDRLRAAARRTAAASATTRSWRRATSSSAWPRKDPRLAKVRPAGLEDTPQFKIDVDQQKATALGVSLADVNQTLAVDLGRRATSNDFIDKGRTKRVYMQADAPFRMSPEDLGRWYVRNRQGEMVPFSAFATRPLDLRLAEARALQRHPADGRSRARPRRATAPARRWRRSRRLATQLPAGIGVRVVGPLVRGAAVGRERAGAVRASRCSSCSSASPRCTRAGRSRSRSCSSCRSASSARSLRDAARAASRTTCTSRSACSRRSACRRRTRS